MPDTGSATSSERSQDSDNIDELIEAMSDFGNKDRSNSTSFQATRSSGTFIEAPTASNHARPSSSTKVLVKHTDGRIKFSELPNTRITRSRRLDPQPAKQKESMTVAGWFKALFNGSETPPEEFKEALLEHDRAQLAKLQEQNRALEEQNAALWDANDKYEVESKDHDVALREQREHYGAKYVKMKDARDEYYGRYKSLEQVVQDLRAEVRRAQDLGKQEVKAAMENAEALKRSAGKEVAAAKQVAADLHGRAEAADRACREFEQQIKSLTAKIRNMQEAQLQSVEAAVWAGPRTAQIEDELKLLHMKMFTWSTEYSNLTLEQLLEPECFKLVAKGLKERGCIADAHILRESLLQNPDMRKSGRASSMLLMATVSFDIAQKVIGDPYFAFSGTAQSPGHMLRRAHATALQDLLEIVEDNDEEGAEAVRCQLMRLLDPPDNDQSEEANEIRSLVQTSRQSAIMKLVSDIIDDTIIDDMSDQDLRNVRAELEDIVQEAAELSRKLWTRKARMEVKDFTHFLACDEYPKYGSASENLEAHTLHNKALSRDRHALDGQKIIVLCSPLIMTAGGSDGQKFEKKMVLKKAAVWTG